jgi:hypothetical protein
MKDGTPTILYTKETGGYARHVRGPQVSVFSLWSRINHVTRGWGTFGKGQGLQPFAHVKRVTLQVIRRRKEEGKGV